MSGTGKAIGIIEGHRLLPLIEAANAMRKAVEVSLHVLRPIGGGIVLGVASGEIGAVRVALETAEAGAAERDEVLRTRVFAHPSPEVWELLDRSGINMGPE